jgi:signal transduction histidine kinase
VFGLSNPIIVALLILLVLVSVIYIFYRYILIPLQKEHLQEQQSLRLQQAELMAMFAQSDPDPVFRFEIDGSIQLSNSPGSELLKGTSLINMKIWEIIPETKAVNLAECIRSGARLELHSNIGNRHYKFILCGIPKFEIGQIYGSDITDLKLTEVQLKEALVKAEESEKLKSHFLAQMSHEIRTPLNAILGLTSIIHDELKDKISPDLMKMFSSIDNSGRRLYRTIDLNLNMALVMTSGYKCSFQRLDIIPIINQLTMEFRHYAREKNLSYSFEETLGGSLIYADAYSFTTVMQNLLDNAIKYTRQGSVSVTAAQAGSGYISVTVKDTGIGMSQEYMEKLFHPFTQEIMGYSRPFEGNGLGLALSKRLLELNKGDIRVHSIKGTGTEVTILLPQFHYSGNQ